MTENIFILEFLRMKYRICKNIWKIYHTYNLSNKSKMHKTCSSHIEKINGQILFKQGRKGIQSTYNKRQPSETQVVHRSTHPSQY